LIALLQRVRSAHVDINQKTIASIQQGLLVFAGFDQHDDEPSTDKMLSRLLNYRIFADANDKMNLSLLDIKGHLLIVPQFTLVADTTKGRRPSFAKAAAPELGQRLFHFLVSQAGKSELLVQTGEFGADMQVHLQNDGPATFILK